MEGASLQRLQEEDCGANPAAWSLCHLWDMVWNQCSGVMRDMIDQAASREIMRFLSTNVTCKIPSSSGRGQGKSQTGSPSIMIRRVRV